jgi:hypothetical protein
MFVLQAAKRGRNMQCEKCTIKSSTKNTLLLTEVHPVFKDSYTLQKISVVVIWTALIPVCRYDFLFSFQSQDSGLL